MFTLSPGRTRALSALTINLSAAWFGAALITPALSLTTSLTFLDLIKPLAWGIMLFEASTQLEDTLLT